ncbi:hypothetical protein BpHYR1_050696 [Brachionus plicatilis]|uniref:Uncharacterized protein n=1 Tax=Brachionus plicatilis TaxID=10195 RepID=A0A3M7P3A4_BRAPC|nr:hypothetical protein BpHYR1_050696 [Brachionus plicatilis]
MHRTWAAYGSSSCATPTQGSLWQRVPHVSYVKTRVVGYARVNVAVDCTIFGAAVYFEKVRNERHLVHDWKNPAALINCKVIVAPVQGDVRAHYHSVFLHCSFGYSDCSILYIDPILFWVANNVRFFFHKLHEVFFIRVQFGKHTMTVWLKMV